MKQFSFLGVMDYKSEEPICFSVKRQVINTLHYRLGNVLKAKEALIMHTMCIIPKCIYIWF